MTAENALHLADRLPAINATCNALSALCLIFGYRAIRRLDIATHKKCMLAAVSFSGIFLVGYLTRYYLVGVTRYGGVGIWRTLYFSILFSHMVLAVITLPLVITILTFALRGTFERHKKWAKVTFPIWLYVSITGVMIYFLLFRMFPPLPK